MYDVLIIGGGPAGASAAVYTARAGLKTALVYKDFGALETAERIENFYGFSRIGGKSLVEKGLRQARKMGAKTICGEVLGLVCGAETPPIPPTPSIPPTHGADDTIISKDAGKEHPSLSEKTFVAQTSGGLIEARTVLLATGASRSVPKIPGLAEFEGRGVSYCAVCDGFFYRGKHVAVLGNGAYALHEVADLLPLAASVTLLTNGGANEDANEVANEATHESANKTLRLEALPDSVKIRTEKVSRIIGEIPENIATFGLALMQKNPQKVLSGVILESGEKIPLSGLFVAEGTAGATALARKIGAEFSTGGNFQGQHMLSKSDSISDYIKIDNEMRTTVAGVWAAGDCTGGTKQIVKAANDGAQAGLSIVKFLRQKRVGE
ncbi:MAG: NAD(P)/FAD-dependent oxidoreductase [Defluviitaleaceae bacterium]|nr:NAD(P)/FAD-dependent oxidoreductase [Defluviitaleaceae bacterium]